MAKYQIKTPANHFFRFDKAELSKIFAVGVIFGILTVVLRRFGLHFGSEIVNYRMALILSGVVLAFVLLNLRVSAALAIVVVTIASLWNQFLLTDAFWLLMLIYALLGAAMMLIAGWIWQTRFWQFKVAVSILVVVIFSLI